MLFLEFEFWQENELAVATATDGIVECPDCHGEGLTDDECSHCGRGGEICCATCEGDGDVKFNSLDRSQASKLFSKKEYLKVIKLEFSKLANYTGKNESEMYFEAGFIAYCQIKGREVFLSE